MGKVKIKDLPEKYQRYITYENRDLITIHDNHGRPVTRRDFLAAGLITSTASLILPGMGAFSNSAFAQAMNCADNAPAAAAALPVFINVNLSGGYAVASNVKPMDAGGQPLTSYSLLGLGATAAVPVEVEMNLNWAGPVAGSTEPRSFLLRGIRAAAPAAVRAKVTGNFIASSSSDDTNSNPSAIVGLINRAGLKGSVLPYLGNVADTTGVDQNPAYNVNPSVQPLRYSNLSSITNAIGAGNSALGTLSAAQRAGLFDTIGKLSAAQSRSISSVSGGTTLSQGFGCAVEKNKTLAAAAPPPIDPRQAPAYAAIWGLAANSGDSNTVGQAGAVRAALMGLSVGAAINIGGYDYHGNARTETDNRDLAAGTLIGRILASAEAVSVELNRPVSLFLHVTSDGAVSSDNSQTADSQHNSDAGNHGGALCFVYKSTGAPQAIYRQLGAFNNSQGVVGNTLVGNATGASAAAFANWCRLAGNMSLFESTLPGVFSTAQLNQIIFHGG